MMVSWRNDGEIQNADGGMMEACDLPVLGEKPYFVATAIEGNNGNALNMNFSMKTRKRIRAGKYPLCCVQGQEIRNLPDGKK